MDCHDKYLDAKELIIEGKRLLRDTPLVPRTQYVLKFLTFFINITSQQKFICNLILFYIFASQKMG